MLHTTPQERLALGVVSLLLLAGAGARWLAAERAPAAWVDSRSVPADTLSSRHPEFPRAAAEQELKREQVRNAPLAAGERIDPNRASAEQLERLPRVGPALAKRIVAHREAQGPFRTLADLDAVAGVGPALLRSLEPHLTLPPAPGTHARSGDAPLDLNRATASELEALPGIGPALARRIVEWRAAHGRFRSVEDLEQVPGVGPALRDRLARRLRAGG